MKIEIAGFFGYGNAGDEAILQAMIDSLGWDNEYYISTTLPFNLAEEYHFKLPYPVEWVREIADCRTDYDVYLLGGGGLDWGFGWRQTLAAFAAGKPSMNYGVGYSRRPVLYHPKLVELYKEFLSQFDAVTVRDEDSLSLLREIGVEATLTMCPAINLKEESFSCPEHMIAVCPRLEDDYEPQVEWLVSRLQGLRDEVLLIPLSRIDMRGDPVDLKLCKEIAEKLKGARILNVDGYNPRKIKYAISKSKLVISGGRLHALIWAASHNVPYAICPTALKNWPKCKAFIGMHKKYGDKLNEMEKKNVEIFREVQE